MTRERLKARSFKLFPPRSTGSEGKKKLESWEKARGKKEETCRKKVPPAVRISTGKGL